MSDKKRTDLHKRQAIYTPLNPPSRGEILRFIRINSPLEGGQGGVKHFIGAHRFKSNAKRQDASHTSGYILLEALLAILLLSGGILAVVQAYHRTMYAMQLQQHYLTPAKALAESLLAKQELQALSGLALDDVANTGQQGRFHFRIDFKDWQAVPNLQVVHVTVSWNDRGKPGSLTLSAILPGKQARL